MPVIQSLDNVKCVLSDSGEQMQYRDLAAKLQRCNDLVTAPISRKKLIGISEWLTYLNKEPWEVAIVQDYKTRQLRLVNGEASNSERIPARVGSKYLRPNDIFIVHVHPVVRSLSGHIAADQKTATDVLEGALDWSDILLCYNQSKLYNLPDRRSGVEGYCDASVSARHGRIPFLDGEHITGYLHFDKDTNKPNFVNPFNPRL